MSEENVFKCTNCKKNYENQQELIPKLLNCGHSLCNGCCQQLKKSQVFIQCQICYKLDTRELEKIPDNQTTLLLIINKIQSFIQQKKPDEDKKEIEAEKEKAKEQEIMEDIKKEEENKMKNALKNQQLIEQKQAQESQLFDPNIFQQQYFPMSGMYSQNMMHCQDYSSSMPQVQQPAPSNQRLQNQVHQTQIQPQGAPQLISLFVGNLNINTTEKQIKDIFERFVQIGTIKMLKADTSAQRKACLVTVPSDLVEIALLKLDGIQINGQQCTVEQFRSKQSLNQVRVFVRNLPKSFTEQNLEGMFKEIGKITAVKLQKFPDGQSRCMGYVTFERPESVKLACQKFNNYCLNFQNQRYDLQVFDTNDFNQTKQIQNTDLAQLKSLDSNNDFINFQTGIKRPPETNLIPEPIKQIKVDDPNSFSSIRINYLSEQITKQELEQVFGIEKGIEHIVFQQGPKGKYAYVNFASHEKAQSALKNFNNFSLSDGTKLQLRPSFPKNMPNEFNIPEEKETSTLFLKYFPTEYTENDLKSLFSQFGNIIEIKISKERHVPMALVKFAERENAVKAMNAMKGAELKPGLKLFINWKKGKFLNTDYQLQEAGKTFNMQLPFITQQLLSQQYNQFMGPSNLGPNFNMQGNSI